MLTLCRDLKFRISCVKKAGLEKRRRGMAGRGISRVSGAVAISQRRFLGSAFWGRFWCQQANYITNAPFCASRDIATQLWHTWRRNINKNETFKPQSRQMHANVYVATRFLQRRCNTLKLMAAFPNDLGHARCKYIAGTCKVAMHHCNEPPNADVMLGDIKSSLRVALIQKILCSICAVFLSEPSTNTCVCAVANRIEMCKTDKMHTLRCVHLNREPLRVRQPLLACARQRSMSTCYQFVKNYIYIYIYIYVYIEREGVRERDRERER